MMHMIVMPDIRQGIKMMKFAIKHPLYFKDIKQITEDELEEQNRSPLKLHARRSSLNIEYHKDEKRVSEEDSINTGRVFSAFMLGFFQASICILAQVLIILLLFE